MSIPPSLSRHPVCALDAQDRKFLYVGILLLVVANLARSWESLALPVGFLFEDAIFFSHYYGNTKPFSDVFQITPGLGYHQGISRFFMWIYAHCDVRIQPLLYQWTGFAWGTTAAVLPFFSGLVRGRALLLFGPLLMGLSAMNHVFYYNTLIYTMYSGIAMFLALLFFPPAHGLTGRVVVSLCMLLLPWAGPYCTLVIPLGLLALPLLWKTPARRWPLLLAMASSTAYLLASTGGSVQLFALLNPLTWQMYLFWLLREVLLLGLFEFPGTWAWAPLAAMVAATLWLLRRDHRDLVAALFMLAIVLGSTLMFFVSNRLQLVVIPKDCHLFLSLYFWLFFVLFALDRFLRLLPGKTATTFTVTALLVLIVLDNVRHPGKRSYPRQAGIDEFIAAVHSVEGMHLEEQNAVVFLRLINMEFPSMSPVAVIGSMRPDARILGLEELPEFLEKVFVFKGPDKEIDKKDGEGTSQSE